MATPPFIVDRKFKVERRIGRGGMGSVYLARDTTLGDRPVAIKLVTVESDEARLRFEREAQTAATLQHPNIVTVYQYGEHDGQPYIAMEFIDGDTFATIVEEGRPLALVRKLELIEELCTGLTFAHRHRVVHRDVKPTNLIVDRDGRLKILDFGIARVDRSELTSADQPLGTLNYMAPEQLGRQAVDHRCDIFGVGLVLYELVSCRKAFPGGDVSVLYHIRASDPEPLENLVPDVPPLLVAIIRTALAKRPEDRYQDLVRMRDELGALRLSLEIPVEDDALDPAAVELLPLNSVVGSSPDVSTLDTLDSLGELGDSSGASSDLPIRFTGGEGGSGEPAGTAPVEVALSDLSGPEQLGGSSKLARRHPEPAAEVSGSRVRWFARSRLGIGLVGTTLVAGAALWLSVPFVSGPAAPAGGGERAPFFPARAPVGAAQARGVVSEPATIDGATVESGGLDPGTEASSVPASSPAVDTPPGPTAAASPRPPAPQAPESVSRPAGSRGSPATALQPAAIEVSGVPPAFAFALEDRGEPAGDSLAVSWDFGDGDTATGPSVRHTYTGGGSFTVTATITDSSGESAGSTTIVTVRTPAEPQLLASLEVEPPRTALSFVFLEAGGDMGYRIDSVDSTWFFEDGSTLSGSGGLDGLAEGGSRRNVSPNGHEQFSVAVEGGAVVKVEYVAQLTDEAGTTTTLAGVVEP